MQNHIYSFAGKIWRQTEGGAIGNKLTGALATVWMLYWARIFKNNIQSATEDIPDFKFYFLKYYVDDGNMASESLPAGARLIDGKVKIIEEFIESDYFFLKISEQQISSFKLQIQFLSQPN